MERFGLEKAGNKDAEVHKKMEECLQRLDEIQGIYVYYVYTAKYS